MNLPIVKCYIPIPDKKWREIEDAIATGNKTQLDMLIQPLTQLEKIRLVEEGKIKEDTSNQQIKYDIKKTEKSIEFFVYNTVTYDFPKDKVEDLAISFAKDNNLPDSMLDKLRIFVADVQRAYIEDYQSDYSEYIRSALTSESMSFKFNETVLEDYDYDLDNPFSEEKLIEIENERERHFNQVEAGVREAEDFSETRGHEDEF